MNVIAIANTKGGVGKTTITVSLAARCCEESDNVALLDLDPQKSLLQWWKRRGEPENPTMYESDSLEDAVAELQGEGIDWLFIDGPPAFLTVVEEAIRAADFTVIPLKPSMLDVLATEDAITLAHKSDAAFMVVINDVVGSEKMHESARKMLEGHRIPVAETIIKHRQSHIQAMTVGKSGAEVNNGKDKAATAEIESLWKEIKAATLKASKKRQRAA